MKRLEFLKLSGVTLAAPLVALTSHKEDKKPLTVSFLKAFCSNYKGHKISEKNGGFVFKLDNNILIDFYCPDETLHLIVKTGGYNYPGTCSCYTYLINPTELEFTQAFNSALSRV